MSPGYRWLSVTDKHNLKNQYVVNNYLVSKFKFMLVGKEVSAIISNYNNQRLKSPTIVAINSEF